MGLASRTHRLRVMNKHLNLNIQNNIEKYMFGKIT